MIKMYDHALQMNPYDALAYCNKGRSFILFIRKCTFILGKIS